MTRAPEPGDPGTHMGFVGVSTAGSSIRTVFPHWADALGLPTRVLVGHDVPLDAPSTTYRDLVTAIADNPRHWGALVTTHKMAVHDAAADLFDELDDLATTFGEISCVTKRGDRLVGSAKDPVTARLAVEEILPADHFATSSAEAQILGSGGAGTALSQQLGVRADRPAAITCTAVTAAALDHARAVHERSELPADLVRYVVTRDPDHTDALLASLPAGSLVVNATGMGKDRPGSPLGPEAVFPRDGVVWEFNYRGSLEFWHQALAQRNDRSLRVHDGWRYFVHGWTQAVADVFGVAMLPATIDELGAIAARNR